MNELLQTSTLSDFEMGLSSNIFSIPCNVDENDYLSFELANVQLAVLHTNSAFQIGESSFATGDYSLSSGFLNSASGYASVAHGTCCESSGTSSSTMGISSKATGLASHSNGIECISSGEASHVVGAFANDNGLCNSFVWGDGSFITKPTNERQIVMRATNGMKLIVGANVEMFTTNTGSWNYKSTVPLCWAKSPPQSITEAIDRLAKAYAQNKGAIP